MTIASTEYDSAMTSFLLAVIVAERTRDALCDFPVYDDDEIATFRFKLFTSAIERERESQTESVDVTWKRFRDDFNDDL